MSDTNYCRDCKNINCPEGRVNCKYPDAIACDLYRDTPPTVFERITESAAVMAEEFVDTYIRWGEDGHPETLWRSNFRELSGMLFDTKEEAIAATVEKLKEVENG